MKRKWKIRCWVTQYSVRKVRIHLEITDSMGIRLMKLDNVIYGKRSSDIYEAECFIEQSPTLDGKMINVQYCANGYVFTIKDINRIPKAHIIQAYYTKLSTVPIIKVSEFQRKCL
jgi:hypothetical protein